MNEGSGERDERWGSDPLRVREARTQARRLARALRHQLHGATHMLDIGIGLGDRHEERQRHEDQVERIFTVVGIPTLRVSNFSGDTRIGAGETGVVTVRARRYVRGASAERAKQLLESFDVDMVQDGDTIVVTPEHTEQNWRDLFRGRQVSVDLDITVPRETVLDARSMVGDLQVRALHGRFALQNVSGDTVLEDLQGALHLRTVSGDVRATSFVGQCECNSVSGDLGFAGALLRQADLHTVSGDISFDGALDAASNHRFRSVSGDVSLALAGPSFRIDYRTLSGDLDCQREARVAHEGRRDRLVMVGEGLVWVQVKTVGGDLRVAGSESVPPVAAVAETPKPAAAGAEPAAPSAAVRAVLDRLSRGELSVDDALGLVGTLGAQGGGDPPGRGPAPRSTDSGQTTPEDARPPGARRAAGQRGRILRVRVTEGGSPKVNIAIPLAIARLGNVNLGGVVRGHLGKFGIDLDEVLRQAELTGRIVDIADGADRIEIFVD